MSSHDQPAAALPLCRFQPESVQAIFDALQDAVIVIDAALRIVSLNRAAAALLGRAEGAAAGVPLCDLFPAHSCPRDVIEETVRTGRAVLDFQTAVQLAGGAIGQVIMRTVPLRGDDGARAGAAVILRDVTEETTLRKQVSGRYRLGGIVGKSQAMQRLYSLIEDVAPSSAAVLLRGETGTGKELAARAIHYASTRAEGPFVQVNCSALSEGLLESELFGHVRGAFTGAVADRRGRFAEAHGGTLLLDEVGDISPAVQVKLLRVLQERVFERVGDNRPQPVDVRVISATHRDLEALVASGRVREDFYYRIKVVSLWLPPLRQRREDIPLLVAHFLARLRGAAVPTGAAPTGAAPTGAAQPVAPAAAPPPSLAEEVVSPAALRALMDHLWPGNVRELENAVEHAVVLSRGRTIRPEHLPPEVMAGAAGAAARPLSGAPPHSPAERELIQAALARTGWNRTRAARLLGIDRTTLWRKLREYDLRPEFD